MSQRAIRIFADDLVIGCTRNAIRLQSKIDNLRPDPGAIAQRDADARLRPSPAHARDRNRICSIEHEHDYEQEQDSSKHRTSNGRHLTLNQNVLM
jgi:hypothetical protein